jgi:hypothetical protein
MKSNQEFKEILDNINIQIEELKPLKDRITPTLFADDVLTVFEFLKNQIVNCINSVSPHQKN